MTATRCPRRSRSTRRDPLPHTLRFVRHRPWFFRFGALRLVHGLVVILGRLSRCYFFLLAFPYGVCGVGALGVLVRRRYYEKISGHDLGRGLGRSVAGNRACVRVLQAPAGCTLLGGAGEDQQHGTPQFKTFRSGLCAGYRRRLRRRLAASPTLPAGFLEQILSGDPSGAPSCASVSPQHQQQCISKSVVDCCVASTLAC
jgi:hypothetical protein